MFVADEYRPLEDAQYYTLVVAGAEVNVAVGAVMGVMRFRSGVLASFHDTFTIRHAGTGLEVHGTEGSLVARDVMTQLPVGEVFLRRGDRVEEVDVSEREDLYVRSVSLFDGAVPGEGRPAATDEDGLRSLAVALAVEESARTGRHDPVAYGSPGM